MTGEASEGGGLVVKKSADGFELSASDAVAGAFEEMWHDLMVTAQTQPWLVFGIAVLAAFIVAICVAGRLTRRRLEIEFLNAREERRLEIERVRSQLTLPGINGGALPPPENEASE